MADGVTILRAETPAQYAIVAQLMTEYVAWLPFELCFQDYDAEVGLLHEMYGRPGGSAYIAVFDGKQSGVVAFRRLRDGIAELKRMWVRPPARGHGIGRVLAETAIAGAAAGGYRRVRLDTVEPAMSDAIALYESLGFVDIPAYYDNPIEGARYMELDLGMWQSNRGRQ